MIKNFYKLALLLIFGSLAIIPTRFPTAAEQASRANTIYLPLVQKIHNQYGIAPPVLKWQRGGCYSSWCERGWYSSPAVADLDGDGTDEVIASAYSIVALDGETGSLIWRIASGHDRGQPGASNSGRTWPGIVVADVDGDHTDEIVTAHGGGYVSVYDWMATSPPVGPSSRPVATKCAGCRYRTWIRMAAWRSSPPVQCTAKSIPGFMSMMASCETAGRSWQMTAAMLTESLTIMRQLATWMVMDSASCWCPPMFTTSVRMSVMGARFQPVHFTALRLGKSWRVGEPGG